MMLAGIAGSLVVRALMFTVRYRTKNMRYLHQLHAEGKMAIFGIWHGRMLIPSYYYHNRPVKILISMHADGEYIARIMARLGFKTVRGSTSRGGAAAVRKLMEAAESRKYDLAITPDGPRGPRFCFQPGAVYIARETGMPILPVGLGFSRAWQMGSWDGFLVPKPFAEARICLGLPVYVPPDADSETIERVRQQVEETLRAVTREAEAGWKGNNS